MAEAEPFYDDYAAYEWDRLERHRTEFAVTLRAMEEFLPTAPCSILDIGGGPGRYAIELTQRGYYVSILDISSQSLQFAKDKAHELGVSLNTIIHANALDLTGVASASFDAVLLMGPLYHLLSKEDRVQAVQEAMRVLKLNGRLIASFITRFAPFRNAASVEPDWLVDHWQYALRMLETGLHEEPTQFAKAYFIHPDDVIPLMEGCGLQTLRLMGCEGVAAGHEEKINEFDGNAWQAWVELNYRLGQESSLYGASDHLLYIGEKTG
jgi:S-adenosylmethionine-dependent methyltransferase